jgi:uncharacterized membrane protein
VAAQGYRSGGAVEFMQQHGVMHFLSADFWTTDVWSALQWTLRIGLAVMFAFMGITHFLPKVARTMAAMIPPGLYLDGRISRDGILSPINLVRFTGICELAGAIGLLVPWTRFAAAVCLVIFLIAVFPANAHAAANPKRFGRAAFPFWPRYFAQLALIAAVMLAVI